MYCESRPYKRLLRLGKRIHVPERLFLVQPVFSVYKRFIKQWRIPVSRQHHILDLFRIKRRFGKPDMFGKPGGAGSTFRLSHRIPDLRRIWCLFHAHLEFKQCFQLHRRRSLVQFWHALGKRLDQSALYHHDLLLPMSQCGRCRFLRELCDRIRRSGANKRLLRLGKRIHVSERLHLIQPIHAVQQRLFKQ